MCSCSYFFFFFNDTATTEIYTLSLHDALPISNLALVAEDPSTTWTPTTVDDWYGGGERTVEVASGSAVWYSTGLPAVPIRWVMVHDRQGAFPTQALLCTDLGAEPEQILRWFVLRW